MLLLPACLFAGRDDSADVFPRGAVASPEAIAARTGVEVLNAGGNAFDAAIAMGFMLSVTHPHAGNLGGGGFALLRPASGRVHFLDFREVAPGQASRDMYLDEKGNLRSGLSLRGPLAAGVPGSVAGLALLHEEFGSMPWDSLVLPAARQAREGYPLDRPLAERLARHLDKFLPYEESQSLFTREGKPLVPGDLLIQENLALTLERIANHGAEEFYSGQTAKELVETTRTAGGILDQEDLENYEPRWRAPLQIRYRGWEVFTPGLPSGGGVVLAEMLNLLEGFPLADIPADAPQYVSLLAEAARHAQADRNLLLGDPDFLKHDPVPLLTSKAYAEKIRSRISPMQPLPSREVDHSTLLYGEKEETAHLSVVDRWGNAISLTTTLNGSFGSGFVAGKTGILLNNEMDDFTIQPGHPNLYGLIQGEANTIAPGKRMLSSMAPTIVTRNGNLALVLGTPGGATIPTSICRVLTAYLDRGLPLATAVKLPRFHHQHLPDRLYLEETHPARHTEGAQRLVSRLAEAGYHIKERDLIGDVQAIGVDDGSLVPVTDSRGRGSNGF